MEFVITKDMTLSHATSVVVFDILLLLFIILVLANFANAFVFIRRRYLRGKHKR